MACQQFLTFNNGVKMPVLGIGTWQASEEEVEFAIDEALTAGYRHIDTAPVYRNEKAIGRVLKKWLESGKVKREELFIVTKLSPADNTPSKVESAIKSSLSDLQLDYVDVYLVHTPFSFYLENGDLARDENGDLKFDPTTDHIAVWKEMEKIYNSGLARAIGISNFNVKQIQRLLANSTVKPANLQIEYHVYLQQPELINYCKKENIAITAYSPLGSKGIVNLKEAAGVDVHIPDLFDIPEVKEIAAAHKKTPAQVLLRWIIENGFSAIPKSANAQRLRENIDIFDFALTKDEIAKLNALERNIRICDFKFFKGINKHPEFPF